MRTLRKADWFHPDGFPIAVERREPQQPFGLHDHEFAELVIVTSGKGVHVTDEDTWALQPGDVFAISKSRPHDYLNIESLSLINVLFDQDELTIELQDLNSLPGYHVLFRLEPAWRKRHRFRSRLTLDSRQLEQALQHVQEIESETTRRQVGFRCMATASFMQLLGFLSRCYVDSCNADSQSLFNIASAIAHLESNYAQSIQLDDLVQMTNLSRRSFLRDFELATGFTPIAYLINIRIRRAAELLRRSHMPVTEIAYSVGFNDSNYFTRQFRKIMGAPPRSFRH